MSDVITYRLAKVSINGETPVEAYVRNDTWNGHALPYFTKENALKLAEAVEAAGESLTFDEARNAFLFKADMLEPEEVYEAVTIATDDGPVEVYGIGAFNWAWEVEDADGE